MRECSVIRISSSLFNGLSGWLLMGVCVCVSVYMCMCVFDCVYVCVIDNFMLMILEISNGATAIITCLAKIVPPVVYDLVLIM